MNEQKIQEAAQRLYDFFDPWSREDITPADIERDIKENPTETINYLLDMLEA